MLRASVLLLAALAACSGDDSSAPPVEGIRLQQVAGGLASPVFLTAPAGDERLFVVEQPGRIRIVENGSVAAAPFLDITDRVQSGGERGLLSMAFHPRYAQNGLFFVYYTDRAGDIRVDRFRVSADRARADPTSARSVITIPHREASNHNGGLVAFGPDGRLYLGTGDGGGGGDPQRNGQNPLSLLGKILRLDVDGADPYDIPADNPFAGRSSTRNEIWALGVRNPWRFSWDRDTGTLFVADVGQNAWEEVNAVPGTAGGLNFGWNTMEGAHCFPAGSDCATAGKTLPVLEYGRGDGCSITGGYVYRGSALPGLRGHYFYSDYCRGWLRSFRLAGGQAGDRREWEVGDVGNVTSFGEDGAGELYVVTSAGRIFRVVPA
ncbi:MAG: PQQ-dependent sugar dehydrogenase [Gemmatimonadetes bacterium]|nr:PQQ-dependent sugar dehydrogenase [Gemmatimonadota bacterium]